MNLPKGLYEQLITRGLAAVLDSLNSVVIDREGLDPVDSHDILARHVHHVLVQVLRALPEKERLEHQVEICNDVLELLIATLKSSVDAGTMVQAPAEALLSVSDLVVTPSGERQFPDS